MSWIFFFLIFAYLHFLDSIQCYITFTTRKSTYYNFFKVPRKKPVDFQTVQSVEAEKEVAKEIDTWYRIGVIPQPGRKGLKLEHRPKWSCRNSPKRALHLVIQVISDCSWEVRREGGERAVTPWSKMSHDHRAGPLARPICCRNTVPPCTLHAGWLFSCTCPDSRSPSRLVAEIFRTTILQTPSVWQLPPEDVKCRFLADSQTIWIRISGVGTQDSAFKILPSDSYAWIRSCVQQAYFSRFSAESGLNLRISLNSTTGHFCHKSVSPEYGENISRSPTDTTALHVSWDPLKLGSSTRPEGKGLAPGSDNKAFSYFPNRPGWESWCSSLTDQSPSGKNMETNPWRLSRSGAEELLESG